MSVSNGVGDLDPGQNTFVFNFTAPRFVTLIKLIRDVTQYDVDSNKILPSMPGFRIKWNYNHDVRQDSLYLYEDNVEFRR